MGCVGSGFAHVRLAREAALPDAQLVTLPASELSIGVDVLVPLGATVNAAMMDATRPQLIQQFGVGVHGVDLARGRAPGLAVAVGAGGLRPEPLRDPAGQPGVPARLHG